MTEGLGRCIWEPLPRVDAPHTLGLWPGFEHVPWRTPRLPKRMVPLTVLWHQLPIISTRIFLILSHTQSSNMAVCETVGQR